MQSIELLKKNKVEFNILCVLSQANVDKPKELYRFFRSLGIDIPAVHSACRVRRGGQSAALHHHARTIWPLSVRDVRSVVAGAPQGAHPLFR